MQILIIMGAGFIGQQVWNNILPGIHNHYDKIYFFDNNKAKQGTFIKGDTLILSESELLEKVQTEKADIILATDQWKQFYRQCMKWGIDEKIISICNKYNFNNPYLGYCYSQEGEEFYLRDIYTAPDFKGGGIMWILEHIILFGFLTLSGHTNVGGTGLILNPMKTVSMSWLKVGQETLI